MFKIIRHAIISFNRFGPLVRHWTMRFEAKHSYFKQLAQSMGNFVNIVYSLAMRHQLYQSYLNMTGINFTSFTSPCRQLYQSYPTSPYFTSPCRQLYQSYPTSPYFTYFTSPILPVLADSICQDGNIIWKVVQAKMSSH